MDTKKQKNCFFSDDLTYLNILIGNNVQGLLTKQLTKSLNMMVFIYSQTDKTLMRLCYLLQVMGILVYFFLL